MSTTILKFEATAFRPQDDDAPDCLAASISIPVEEDDEVIGNTINNGDSFGRKVARRGQGVAGNLHNQGTERSGLCRGNGGCYGGHVRYGQDLRCF